ncbi:MAG TPA: fumarylacetoacetate hydrolase family protein [Bacteroidota bacterium]|nr:fumarylacetoacetate hydrolase family protein [Bacteroidota bacterium]
MKIARFSVGNRIYEGTLRSDGQLVASDGTPFSPEEIRWLPPVVPSKAIGLALNFADHAEELQMKSPEDPALFFKPPSSLIGHRSPVFSPSGVEYMHYEVELVVVIGQRCRRVKANHADDVIKGFTIGNDVTVRDFVKNFYRPPVRAKGYDTFGPLGPFIVTPDEIPDAGNLGLRAFVNGDLRQKGNTSRMIRPIPELIEFISMIMTLEPGDLIWTGTPKGISHVYPGDSMRLEIDGIGALENTVIAEPDSRQQDSSTEYSKRTTEK